MEHYPYTHGELNASMVAAACKGDGDIMMRLISKGANSYDFAFLFAARYDQSHICKLLVSKYGVDTKQFIDLLEKRLNKPT